MICCTHSNADTKYLQLIINESKTKNKNIQKILL